MESVRDELTERIHIGNVRRDHFWLPVPGLHRLTRHAHHRVPSAEAASWLVTAYGPSPTAW